MGSSLSTFSIADPAKLSALQNATFTLAQPGPNRYRQVAPHPHEALTDPTGKFLLLPDLGADLVRVFALDPKTLEFKAAEPLQSAPGSGPRHAAFFKTSAGKTLLYVIHELGNNIVAYDVAYGSNGASLSFSPLFNTSTHGDGEKAANGVTAAEITFSVSSLSCSEPWGGGPPYGGLGSLDYSASSTYKACAQPDKRFLILSSRYENQFTIPNFNPRNQTQIVSDILVTFSVDQATGALTFLQKFPAGGRVPRQFAINKAGTLLAVGLQDDGRVVIIDRDPASGMLKSIIANAGDMGEVTCTVFDE